MQNLKTNAKMCDNENEDQNIFLILRDYAEYKTNLLIFLMTGAIILLTLFVKFCFYLYQVGYNHILQIPNHYINIENGIFYRITVQISIAFMMLVFNLIGYEFLKKRKFIKYLIFLFITFMATLFIFWALVFSLGFIKEPNGQFTGMLIKQSLFLVFVSNIFVLSLCMVPNQGLRRSRLAVKARQYTRKRNILKHQIKKGSGRHQNKRQTLKKLEKKVERLNYDLYLAGNSANTSLLTGTERGNRKKIRYAQLLAVSLYIITVTLVLPLAAGLNRAYEKKDFRVIPQQYVNVVLDGTYDYAILSETEDTYLVSPCIVSGAGNEELRIYLNTQLEVDKKDLVMVNKQFKRVFRLTVNDNIIPR